MEDYVTTIKNYYVDNLSRAAIDYLRSGLNLFHNQTHSYYANLQVSIGNLAISVELMLKSLIAHQSLLLVFRTDLPLELRTLLSNPIVMPKRFEWRKYDIDLRSFSYKTIELDECISCLYILRPDLKQSLQPHLKFLSKCRNASVHLALPNFQKYELDRTAFVALQICKLLKEYKIVHFQYYNLSDKDNYFLDKFAEERVERVRKIIEKAKLKSRQLLPEKNYVSINGWEYYITICPICGSEGILEGDTELSFDPDEDGGATPILTFSAISFKCDICDLYLQDWQELNLSGMETDYDRSDETDEWFGQEYADNDY
ncbi:MAG: hypothetical protein L6277_12040 [Desulfobacterales bacterium]|nr:hypothetical protein [Pseudomonadota bacterium]MBU4355308.1 hypothetical protein [Pseudomonadota bacterium]MCG2772803.1 hypothetical protein [Desulfobacterales bacterium]